MKKLMEEIKPEGVVMKGSPIKLEPPSCGEVKEIKIKYTLSQFESLFEDYMLLRLQSKLSSKGIYSVYCNDFEVWIAPKESKYDFLGEYYKWSTHRAKIVRFGLRWDFKKDDWVMSYRKQGSSQMAPL